MANVFTVDTVNSPSTTGSTVLALNATTTAVVLGCIVAKYNKHHRNSDD